MAIRQAVILAGGKGTRLYPLTKTVPKPMVPVGGRPFLEHLVGILRDSGVDDIIFLTGHLAEQIEDHFGDGKAHGVHIRYSREAEPRGTGGALQLARPLLADRFFLLNGDTYLATDWRAMASAFEAAKAQGMLSAHPNTERIAPRNNLRVAMGKVLAYEKRETRADLNAVDAGVSIFSKDVLDLLPPAGTAASLEDIVFPALAARGVLAAWPTTQRFYDIGTPERLDLIRAVMP